MANVVILFGLINIEIASFEKFAVQNLKVTKCRLTDTQETMQKALSPQRQQEFLALQASLIQPVGDKVLSYQRQLYDIGAATQAEFARVTEAQFEAHIHRMLELVDRLANRAPAGSQAADGACHG
ncbi:TIGR01841 family phasin [Cupriavidus pinatubonensis]|uniref:Phasin domain-containing protein n=1 Tax=Cupriavidus pinatubonensis TaxID=248026 RepID=A0ABN7Z9W1_9BURK|nr:TIGR01841 family phasin [Cupriavidus pinatubonensis]CAG9180807.1 hypothetical protein LMG23994_04498 [Cupriavidus pinatubonensis]